MDDKYVDWINVSGQLHPRKMLQRWVCSCAPKIFGHKWNSKTVKFNEPDKSITEDLAVATSGQICLVMTQIKLYAALVRLTLVF